MKKGLISKIQHYSTKDGPGLRTTVFFMECNLRCKWCANPENLEARQRVFYFKNRCQHCGLCVHAAHHHSISFNDVGCIINRDTCDNLMEMVDLCPFDAYERIGKEITSEELVKKLLRDQEFYEIGKGGVTFSGGEAALQCDFIQEVANRLRKHQVHLCLDTAGLIQTEKLKELVSKVDMVLYDIKAIDEKMHIKCTEASNHLILQNAKMIASLHKDMIIRLVIVPTYNDDLEDMKKRIDFIVSLGDCVKQVDILKYHVYGIGKYQQLGEVYPIKETLEVDEEKIDFLYRYGIEKGLKMTIGG